MQDEIERHQTRYIEQVAKWIESRGLCAPAILLIEASKPLAPLGSQLLWFVQPLFGWLASDPDRADDDRALTDWAALLEHPHALDQLVACLERANRAKAEK